MFLPQLQEIGKSWNVRGTFLALRWKQKTQVSLGDCITQLQEIGKSWKVRGRFNPCTSNCLSVIEADTHQETKRALASIQA